MIRCLGVLALLRVLGYFFILHHDAIPDDMLAEVRVTSHHHNYYSAQLLNHHLGPIKVSHTISFFL